MMSRRRGTNLGVVLLATQVLGFGMHKIPPATLALIAGQTAIFLDMFPKYFPALENVCLSPFMVYHNKEWRRLILGALSHGSDMHLYYNMLSLLYKGSWLEKRFGTVYFAYLISIFTVLTGVVYIGLELLLGNNLSCAVGFSGQSQRTTFSAQGTSGYGYRRGAAPSAPPYDETFYNSDTNSRSYETYTGGLNEDEQYQRAMQESMRNSNRDPNSQGLYPDLDDLRSRRSHFYS